MLSDIELVSYPLESALVFHTQLDPAVLRNGLFLDPGRSRAVFQLEPRQRLPVGFCASRCLRGDLIEELVRDISILVNPQALGVPFQTLKTDEVEN